MTRPKLHPREKPCLISFRLGDGLRRRIEAAIHGETYTDPVTGLERRFSVGQWCRAKLTEWCEQAEQAEKKGG